MANLPPNTPILLLREGTDTSQGKGQLLSNISACVAIADVVRTTLGPRGMDKIIEDGNGGNVITNDGATILTKLNIAHPAAHTLVQIAQSQDAEVGDGTTSVVLLAGAFLDAARPFVEDGVHPATIIKAYRKAVAMAVAHIKKIRVEMEFGTTEHREMLVKCAHTTLNSKLIGGSQGSFFAEMTVDAVQALAQDLPLEMIGVKKVHGGALEDTQLVMGVAFQRTFSYAGFEQQPKRLENPKVICLNLELELRAEKDNAEVRLKDPSEYQRIVDAEWKILFDKLESIVTSGANVVLSQLSIGDVATQYFADRGIFSAGRVGRGDIERVLHATGGIIQTTVSGLTEKSLGTCGLFEEKQIGSERYNFFTGCPQTTTATIILRGGAEQFIEEAERSLHDAIMIVRRAMKHSSIVAGGGAIEMELSKVLHSEALKIDGKEQLMVSAFAHALETIPRQLCDNAGFDATDILNELRQAHDQEGTAGQWMGVDIDNEGITNTLDSLVWEPALVKQNALQAAAEATCLLLSIDETIKAEKSQVPDGGPARG